MITNLTSTLPAYLSAAGFQLLSARTTIVLTFNNLIMTEIPQGAFSVRDYINLCLAILAEEYSPGDFTPTPFVKSYYGGLP